MSKINNNVEQVIENNKMVRWPTYMRSFKKYFLHYKHQTVILANQIEEADER